MAEDAVAEGMAGDMEKRRRKEEKKKKKNQAKGSLDGAVTANHPAGESKAILLRSIAAYLEKNGFLKAVSSLRSEPQLEVEDWSASSLKLEDMISNYLDSSNHPENLIMDKAMEQDVAGHDFTSRNSTGKKKKNTEIDGRITTQKVVETCKKDHDGKGENAAFDSAVSCLEGPIGDASENVKASKSGDKKKHKNKQNSEALAADSSQLNDGQKEMVEDCKSKEVIGLPPPSENGLLGDEAGFVQKKDRNKRKRESSKEGADAIIEPVQEESKQGSFKNTTDEQGQKENVGDCKSKKVKRLPPTENGLELGDEADFGQKKDRKKRKMEVDATIEPVTKEHKQGGLKNTTVDEQMGEVQSDSVHLTGDGSHIFDKKRKNEGSNLNNSRPSKISAMENVSVLNNEDGANGHDDVQNNGKIEKNESENKSTKKKKEKNPVEPKSINAFSRVKAEDVKFADDRLQDNSYWAKGGAENGYGAKAQAVLGQVKGRDFRHEKTKKKRGSYRGGVIDLQSHSIKFECSDDDE